MISKAVKIDELKRIIIKDTKKLDKSGFAKKCLTQLETYMPIFKQTEKSVEAKAKGNILYGQKDLTFIQLYEILVLFNKSIAYASNYSKELAVAYANKSAVLLRMRKYRECISEIDNALKITESNILKVKLLCRKAECLTALGSANSTRCLQKAKFILTKVEDSKKEKPELSKLIDKTQMILEKEKLDIPKEDKRITQGLEMIKEAERRDLSESIMVKYSEIYGWHLIAARDYEPGDIVVVEKPYLNCLDDSRAFHYCDYCLAHLWTAVPCDNCPRSVYCSEECKTQAWNQYHEMECYAMAFMRIPFPMWSKYVPIVVRLFCKVLKEAGTIEQLVADSEASQHHTDQNSSTAPSSLNSTSYRRLFTVPVDIEQDDLKNISELSIITLMGLAKYTKILGKTYHFMEMKKLMKDDTAITVGALLMKFTLILTEGSRRIPLTAPGEQNEDGEISYERSDEEYYKKQRHLDRIFPTLIAHTVNGCIPNVECHSTHGNKAVLCAIIPIQAGEKLIEYHPGLGSIWKKANEPKKQLSHLSKYGRSCECQACTENWPEILADSLSSGIIFMKEMHTPLTAKLWVDMNAIVLDWKANRDKPNYPDNKMLFRAMNLSEAAFHQLRMPSPLLIVSVLLLSNVLHIFYDRSEIYSRAPHLRPQDIGSVIYHYEVCPCDNKLMINSA